MTRAQWKAGYRQIRIIRRESAKAWTDAMIYGRGAVKMGDGVPDRIRHVTVGDMGDDWPASMTTGMRHASPG